MAYMGRPPDVPHLSQQEIAGRNHTKSVCSPCLIKPGEEVQLGPLALLEGQNPSLCESVT